MNYKTYEQSTPGEVHDGKHLKPPAKDKLHPLRGYGVPLGVFPDARTNTGVPRSILFYFNYNIIYFCFPYQVITPTTAQYIGLRRLPG